MLEYYLGNSGSSKIRGEEMKRLIVNFTIVVFTMSAIGSVDAAIMPTDLNSGDPYYLAFVTQGTRDAVSGDIADYN